MLSALLQHRIVRNIFSLGVLQIANYIVPLLGWPLMGRMLGVEQFGVIMMLLAICAMANILTDFGFNLSATHTIAQDRENKYKVAQLLGNIFAIKGILALLSCFIVTVYMLQQFQQDSVDIWTFVLVNLTVVVQAFSSLWFFYGIEKMSQITKVNIVAKVSYVVILFLVLPIFLHINVVLLCFLISQLLITVLCIRLIKKEGYFIKMPKAEMLWYEIKYSFGFFISRVAVSVYTLANTLVLGHFNGAAVAGLYGAAEKLYGAGNGVAGMVSQAVYPYMVKHSNLKLLLQIAIGLAISVMIGAYILSFFSEDLIVLLFGEEFRMANEYFKVFLIILCLSSVSMLFGYPAFSVVKKVQWANYTVVIGALLYLVGLLVLFYKNAITAIDILNLVLLIEIIILCLRVVMIVFFYRGLRNE